ncbi:hypothetical protein GCM10010399_59140 [Dactylosporangium fulvum]
MTFVGERSSDRAVSDAASANISPIAGNTTVIQARPVAWYTTTRATAAARHASMYRSRDRAGAAVDTGAAVSRRAVSVKAR